PTGNYSKNPSTGFGSPSFLLGVTAYRLATEWYWYTSYGALLTTRHGNDSKGANHFLYQAGFGKNIAYATDKWTLMWELEFSGIYEQKKKIHGEVDQDSGGNTIFFGPSLWFSTQRIFLLASVAPVIYEHLFGEQIKSKVLLSIYFGGKFN